MPDLDLLFVGDANPDLVMTDDAVPAFGQAEQVVDAAPVFVGGSGAITACGAARLGLRTAFVGTVGNDAFGHFMLDALSERSVDTSACAVTDVTPTGISVVPFRGDDRATLTSTGAMRELRADAVDAALLARTDTSTSAHSSSCGNSRTGSPCSPKGPCSRSARRRTSTTTPPTCSWRGSSVRRRWNLLRGRATGGRVTVGDVELGDPHVPEGEVLVGIRPKGLRPVGEDHAGPVFEVCVDVVEPLGDEVLVHGSIEGRVADVRIRAEDERLLADTESDRAKVTLRLPPEERPKPGSRLRVSIAQHAVRLFDPTTGLAVRPR